MPPELSDYADALPLTTHREFELPMTLGVISDTHVNPRGGRRMPMEALDLFERFRVGLIVHLGDINCEDVLYQLADVAPLIAVVGNNDNPFLQRQLPAQLTFTVGAYTVGAIHGHEGITARQTAIQAFANTVDLCLYGHSHVPKIERIDETIFFNPGSATERRFSEHCGVGLIQFLDRGIEPELVLYKEPGHLRNIRP
jgi:putative phosphoesterase